MFKSRCGFLLLNFPLESCLGVEAESGVCFLFGVCGSKKELGCWDVHLGFRLSKGLKRESKVSVDELKNPELKFGIPQLQHSHDIFFRSL